MRVLLVEDDARLSASLAASLRDAGYAVDAVGDGEQAELFAESTPYDGIILDVMLPKRDGVLVCRTLRARGLTTPILMLTARDAIEDRVQGLDSGADDYLVSRSRCTSSCAAACPVAAERAQQDRRAHPRRPQRRSGDARRHPRRAAHHALDARVRPAGVPPAPSPANPDARDDREPHLELRFHVCFQCGRCLCAPPAPQD